MYRILAAINDTEQMHAQIDAIEDLLDVSDEVTVYLLHVFTDNPSGASVHQVEAIREAMDRLDSIDVDVQPIETSGEPSVQILEQAAEHDVDQICIGGRKRSPTGKALFGSVSQDVLLSTGTPVLVCGGETGA
jgi:nucleotide-binding universal stress UspA family protein